MKTWVYLWVAWRERTLAARLVWSVLFPGLGSIATAIHMLLTLAGRGNEPLMAPVREEASG